MSEEEKTPQSAQSDNTAGGASSQKPVFKKPALKKAAPAGTPPGKPTIKIGAKPVAKTPRIDLADKTAEEASQPAPAKPSGEAEMGALKQAIQKTSAQMEPARKDLQKPSTPPQDIGEKEVPPAAAGTRWLRRNPLPKRPRCSWMWTKRSQKSSRRPRLWMRRRKHRASVLRRPRLRRIHWMNSRPRRLPAWPRMQQCS